MQDTYSTNVRFPGEMKERMQETAAEEFRSLNSLIVAAVNQYLTDPNRPGGDVEETQEADSMADNTSLTLKYRPRLGIKCRLYADGSVVLEQYDPYVDDGPNFVEIRAHQLDTVIGFTQFRNDIEAS